MKEREWEKLFVGRDAPLAQMKAAWHAAKTNGPQLLTVLAEPGFGKTRLVQEFYRWLSDHEQSEPSHQYWPKWLGKRVDNLLISPLAENCQIDNRCSIGPAHGACRDHKSIEDRQRPWL